MSQLSLLASASQRVGATSRRTVKAKELSECLRELAEDEVAIATLYLSGDLPQGKIGIGYAALRSASNTPPSDVPQLTIHAVDATLTRYASIKGAGSAAVKSLVLNELFAQATADEQTFLLHLLSGELRQGALAGVMIDAIAAAADIPVSEVRRAAMYAPHLGAVAHAAVHRDRAALMEFQLATLSPVAPMLAETAADVADALEQLGPRVAWEWKIDGARIQVHKHGDDVRVYTRNLNDVAASVPEVAEAVKAFSTDDLVLDGEVVALGKSGQPLPFQVTMRRFGRKLNVDTLRRELPLSPFFFDCLKLNGVSLADRPTHERLDALMSTVPKSMQMPRLVSNDLEMAQSFYTDALAKGHEGIMAKSLDAPYEAGKRGASWLKIKRAHTLDLVVLAAEWGSGRRKGSLSNLHLGARGDGDKFVMLGKTFKGLTDAILAWQTKEFLAREIKRDAITVYVRPELVVEVAFNDIQSSSQYPGGYALRFARVKRYRPDKHASEADTMETIKTLFNAQSGVERGGVEGSDLK
jgi:DNA ligase-1